MILAWPHNSICSKLTVKDNYKLYVEFDDGHKVVHDVMEVSGLFKQAQLDSSRTCVYWNDEINVEQNEKTQQESQETNSGVKTTQEEIDAYNIIKAILHKDVDVSRISMRDAVSYCAILFDNNNRKPIVRLYFNNLNNLRIALITEDGKEEKYNISSLDALYDYDEKFRDVLKRYLN